MSNAQLVVVVTGCSAGGIGASLCEAFLAKGARVFAASRSLTKMETLHTSIERVELDVNDEENVKQGVESILAKTGGRIDILVNNAGQGCISPLIEVDMKRLRETFNVNVFGLVMMIQAVAPSMIRNRAGTIINISSIVSYVPTPWASVYCASKAAVHSFSDCLRMELAGFGINVMCVAPGAIKSGIGAANDKSSLLKEDSFYLNVESAVRSRGSWSQTPYSTPSSTLADSIVAAALSSSGPPRNLASGYRSTAALLSFYLPTAWKEYFWGTGFGILDVGKE